MKFETFSKLLNWLLDASFQVNVSYMKERIVYEMIDDNLKDEYQELNEKILNLEKEKVYWNEIRHLNLRKYMLKANKTKNDLNFTTKNRESQESEDESSCGEDADVI